jgi:hypothetical protein
MVQRQQTLWLILSAFCALLSFKFPFVTGKGMSKDILTDITINSNTSLLLMVLTGICFAIAAITIFLYKDRKAQLKLCLGGIFAAALLLFLFILQMNKLEKSTLALASILPFAILVGFFMAYRGVRHDEKLVKSLDKLR